MFFSFAKLVITVLKEKSDKKSPPIWWA